MVEPGSPINSWQHSQEQVTISLRRSKENGRRTWSWDAHDSSCTSSALKKNIYLIFGSAGSSLLCRCSTPASHCSGFSCCGTQALGAQASVVWAPGLRCSVAHEIFLDQSSNPCPLHWQVDFQPLDHQGNPCTSSLTWEETEQIAGRNRTGLSWKQDFILGQTVSYMPSIYGNDIPTGKPGHPLSIA